MSALETAQTLCTCCSLGSLSTRTRNPGSTIVADAWDPGPSDLDLLRRRVGAEELAIVTAQGRLLESGSHEALLAADGAYAAMVQAQHGD